jgi:hypothetical protein
VCVRKTSPHHKIDAVEHTGSLVLTKNKAITRMPSERSTTQDSARIEDASSSIVPEDDSGSFSASLYLSFTIFLGCMLYIFWEYSGILFIALIGVCGVLGAIYLCKYSNEDETLHPEQEAAEAGPDLENAHNHSKPSVEPLNFDVLILLRYDPRERDSTPINDTCEICLEAFSAGDMIARSPNKLCVHAFHKDCITAALLLNPTCPCCRRAYLEGTTGNEIEEKVAGHDEENPSNPSPNT